MKHRLIAINLPQFHPFKENDEWWGKGFTEWTNVTKARPRFTGHYQPHLPTDTGFYDLRLPEARQMQADMAKEYGIYGFCYYHYWFNGRRLMERPVNEILASGEPDFPFMLCWANENWARNWDGGFKDVLMQQNYGEEDDIAHMEYLCKDVFKDRRYIRVNGKPFFIVYNVQELPDAEKTIKIWREIAAQYGEELYLGCMERNNIDTEAYIAKGFDVAIEFQPHCHWEYETVQYHTRPLLSWRKLKGRARYYWHRIPNKLYGRKMPKYNILWDYKGYSEYSLFLFRKERSYKLYPGITPQWDNSARRVGRQFMCLLNSTPELYGKWLKGILDIFIPFSKEENFVFINAWNEWAEGNHLEPDNKHGRAYLETTKQVMVKD